MVTLEIGQYTFLQSPTSLSSNRINENAAFITRVVYDHDERLHVLAEHPGLVDILTYLQR